MAPITKICRECNKIFDFTDEDLTFLSRISPEFAKEKFEVPPPNLCNDCRRRTRLAWRNERQLYYRTCDFSGKSIVSMYSADKPYKIYREQDWWSDKWNPLDYGRDFDFSKTFFEQFNELMLNVPMLSRNILLCENSDFVNGAANCKNCYLSFNLDYSENCFYVTNAKHCESCMDCYSIRNSELCYECIDVENCYKTYFATRSVSCSDSAFMSDCLRCRHCIGCVGLIGQEYCVFNKKVSVQEFEEIRIKLGSYKFLVDFMKKFDEFSVEFPKKYYFGHSNEDFSGDNIQNVKSSFNCYECSEIENCKNCYYLFQAKNCMDYDIFGDHSEWIYNSIAVGINCSNNLFCYGAWNSSSLNLYCMFLGGSSNNFGCIGLKRNSYCILNKQYTKMEYEKLVAQIINHMKKTGEWGEFFPAKMSPFAYNESVAFDQYPLSKDLILNHGFTYKENNQQNDYLGCPLTLPDSIDEVNDDLMNGILKCTTSKKFYKIIPQELHLYRLMHLPIPQTAPEQRHLSRINRRNPRYLWNRACAECGKNLLTSYSPNRIEKVLCEECYLKMVY